MILVILVFSVLLAFTMISYVLVICVKKCSGKKKANNAGKKGEDGAELNDLSGDINKTPNPSSQDIWKDYKTSLNHTTYNVRFELDKEGKEKVSPPIDEYGYTAGGPEDYDAAKNEYYKEGEIPSYVPTVFPLPGSLKPIEDDDEVATGDDLKISSPLDTPPPPTQTAATTPL